MPLSRIILENVRCIEHAELEIGPRLTLVSGPNASGKTSLLEGIYLIGRGRSFRTRHIDRLIRHNSDYLRATAWTYLESDNPPAAERVLGVEVTSDGIRARIAGENARSLAELAQECPVQAIDPGVHRLVEEGSYGRRRWLDWAVFHVEPLFAETWSRYSRSLRQRNAALRAGKADEASAWDPELASLGESIASARERVLARLEPHWRTTIGALAGLEVELHHQRGWRLESSLAQALDLSRATDTARGITHVGPHRADVAIRLGGHPARDVLSRGQQKLVAASMAIAQLQLLEEAGARRPTLVLDDPAAELDGERLQRLVAAVGTLRCQLVITSLEPGSRLFGTPDRAFHMEQGRVQIV